MSGLTNIDVLLRQMRPLLDPDEYVFICHSDNLPGAVMSFTEAEGRTQIVPRMEVEKLGLVGEFPCRRITLTVHSALDAVGFLARITTALAAAGMGVNPVAGFYHDHLFIPADRADDAMHILEDLTRG